MGRDHEFGSSYGTRWLSLLSINSQTVLQRSHSFVY
mgnify:CR=1 FL=1